MKLFARALKEAWRYWGKLGLAFACSLAAAALPSSYPKKAPDDADWRRIDNDWLGSAAQLALDLNNHANNTRLCLKTGLGWSG
jgi:hypothetical protein